MRGKKRDTDNRSRRPHAHVRKYTMDRKQELNKDTLLSPEGKN